MKTDNSQSIRRNRWFRLASSLMATLFLITCIASCSEEDISGDITGKYGNLTGADVPLSPSAHAETDIP